MLYAQRLKAGWKHLSSLGEGTCNLVHVHDVTRYALAALKQPNVVGEAFNINGPEIVTWNNYLERFNQHLGLPPRTSQPAGMTQVTVGASGAFRSVGRYVMKHHAVQLRWVAHKSDRLKSAMEQAELSLRLTTNQDELNLFGLHVNYLIDKAKHAFGFSPMIGVDAGLAMSIAWLNHMGEAA
jgi:nucleoside-diphosphate-sugar epimerase